MTILSAVVCVRRPEGVLCNGGFESIVSTFWFVIVTMTSVGYGDFSPGTEWCALTATSEPQPPSLSLQLLALSSKAVRSS